MRKHGDNSDGFRNEINIEKCLDFKLYEEVNPNLQHFLQDVFKGYSLKGKRIHAIRCRVNVKPDFYLHIDGIPKEVYVSVKKGSGNSVHQESLDSFITFIKTLGATEEIINAVKLFHFGDGTTDNTGEIRYKAGVFARNNQSIMEKLNDFFNDESIKRSCIERFVFRGKIQDAPMAQYLYHGTAYSGVWASYSEIMSYVSENKHISDLTNICIGPLSYQTWNRNLSFNQTQEHRRYQMQVKWSTLNSVLMTITVNRKATKQRGTEEGTLDEIANVVSFNRDPQSSLFANYVSTIKKSANNILLVRVTTRQYSKLSGQKVLTRSDAYAIEVIDMRIYDILEENEFYLDEDILREYDSYYTFVPFSGISIKIKGSKDYQLLKLTPDSFNYIFESYALGAGASLFCQKLEELNKNICLLEGWKTNIDELKIEFSNNIESHTLTSSLEMCKEIKNTAINRIHTIIDSNDKIQKMIFNGLYLYEEPYVAYFFMQDAKIKELKYMDFVVTTGSGRSKGIYTIVIKPR